MVSIQISCNSTEELIKELEALIKQFKANRSSKEIKAEKPKIVSPQIEKRDVENVILKENTSEDETPCEEESNVSNTKEDSKDEVIDCASLYLNKVQEIKTKGNKEDLVKFKDQVKAYLNEHSYQKISDVTNQEDKKKLKEVINGYTLWIQQNFTLP